MAHTHAEDACKGALTKSYPVVTLSMLLLRAGYLPKSLGERERVWFYTVVIPTARTGFESPVHSKINFLLNLIYFFTSLDE